MFNLNSRINSEIYWTTWNITKKGRKHLGTVIGNILYKTEYVISKVNEWVKEFFLLWKSATLYPYAEYFAFTSGYRQICNYIIRVVPDIKKFLQPVKNIVWNWFIKPIAIRHNEVVDVSTDLLSGVCKNVGKEPVLTSTPISNDNWIHISSHGFWQRRS